MPRSPRCSSPCIIGPWVIEKLREFQIGQYIREEGPKAHQKKAGTPTMGGVLICIAILLPTFLWADLSNPFVWLVMFSTAGLRRHRICRRLYQGDPSPQPGPDRPRQAASTSSSPRGVIAVVLVLMELEGSYSTRLMVPLRQVHPPAPRPSPRSLHIPHLGVLAFLPFIVFVMLLIVGTSNAVNLTDGLDGLAIGCTIIAAGALTVLTYVSGHVIFADYLELQRMPLVSEVTVFCGAMTGASIGFLWYNAHPAEIFMGDVGSLALGGAIGTVAVIIKQELLLPFIGGIFVLEAMSRHPAGGQLQAARRQAHLPHGAAAPSLRADGLVGVQSDCPLLDSAPWCLHSLHSQP